MGREVKCAFCELKVDKDKSFRYKGRNYHAQCYYEFKEKERLVTYICELFSLKAPGPRNYRSIKKYIEENNYTYKGILNSLKYFYEVKKGDKEKANSGIGIVPYIYDEAQEYYKKLKYKNKKIREVVENQKEIEDKKVKITIPKKVQRKKYDIEEL